MFNRCPGSLAGAPTIKVKTCPECGGEVEVFSNDVKVDCENCGFTVYNDVESCIQWCKYAKQCVGVELYSKLKRQRVAFVGVANAARSMLAEALAKEINTSSKLGFVSAGINPASEINPNVLEALQEENIAWRKKPKDIKMMGKADIIVLMGPEVELPHGIRKDATVIQWDVPSPNGRGVKDCIHTAKTLKVKINELIEEVTEGE